MHICLCSWALGIFKNIWIRTYFGPVTVDSVGGSHHFVFSRHGSKLAMFLIASDVLHFWRHIFSANQNLATLDPEKLQGFNGTLQYLSSLLFYPLLEEPHHLQKSVCAVKRPLSPFESAPSSPKRPNLYQKKPILCQKSPNPSQKSPILCQKSPITSKEPNLLLIAPYPH